MTEPKRETCAYIRCQAEAVGVLPRTFAPPWPLCEKHARQDQHPRDINMRKFVRWEGTR